ncbi:MAG: radical SAM family heme chaperone HemW [Proteobacteria bacterium]|nr:radical SAM family heme chaperone HemW [Pseudomonadota bacterium]
MTKPTKPFGLYIHIPFCARLCHYCDFAKTANFDDNHVKRYFSTVEEQLSHWLKFLGTEHKFTSVFFGGGTPGLFGREYQGIFQRFLPYLADHAEISLEANPNNITKERVSIWKDLGVNRLSIGVQTYDPIGLAAMTRDHSAKEAVAAIELALTMIPNINGDLIYGWPGQSRESWGQDLQKMSTLGVSHLSLYALTFEGKTPFARAERRGAMKAMPDEEQYWCYRTAQRHLALAGFQQEEVSNWAAESESCRHNSLYWRGDPFVGLGAGAHGFVPHDSDPIGLRYSYPGDLRKFLLECGGASRSEGWIVDSARNQESWLMEYVGCGLRCNTGIDLQRIGVMGFRFEPTNLLQEALAQGQVMRQGNAITLTADEWFRETAWSGEFLKCFYPHS